MSTTLLGCILIASLSQGAKHVTTETIRLEASGSAFKVYNCKGEGKSTLGPYKTLRVDSRDIEVLRRVAQMERVRR